jgi:hypothetical protein
VFTLENRKMQLQLSMKERTKEISLHTDIQKAEQKAAEEDRHSILLELREREVKVKKLKLKYETIAGRLQKHDEEERTQAYYIIAAAQEREQLQKEGDGLNKTIRNTEKEIHMLSATLDHLNGRNAAYRQSFTKADMRGPDARLRAELEEQTRSISDKVRVPHPSVYCCCRSFCCLVACFLFSF